MDELRERNTLRQRDIPSYRLKSLLHKFFVLFPQVTSVEHCIKDPIETYLVDNAESLSLFSMPSRKPFGSKLRNV